VKLSAIPNNFGDPIGLPVGQVVRPELPDEAIKLAGQYCYLEALDAEKHAAQLYAAYSLDTGGRLWTYMPQGPFSAEAEYRTWVEGVEHKADPFFYAIIDSESNKAVGVASYLRIDPASSSIEVGYITYSPLIQQKPIATEAMYLMMKNAFDMGYRRYEWKCNALNAPSISAAMRLGMSFEGLFRQATMVKGHNRDTAWFAILDRDWPIAEDAYLAWLAPENFDFAGVQKLRLSDLTAPIVESRWPSLNVEIRL
jgi:RimJ/RimL family protein N-acetyltransferase